MKLLEIFHRNPMGQEAAMKVGSIVTRLTGAAKNAVMWGAAWSGLAFGTILALRTVGVVVPAEVTVLDAIGMAVRVGIAGGMVGAVFAELIRVFYRGRRLSDISWVRFGLGGALVAELFMIAFFAIARLASGEGLPTLDYIRLDLIIAAVFGGITAGGSMWLAQRAETRSIQSPDRHERLHAGAAPPENVTHRDPLRARR